MQLILILIFLVPLVSFLISNLFKNNQEKIISNIAVGSAVSQFILSVILFVLWIMNHESSVSESIFTVYKTHDFEFSLVFFYDKLNAVFLLVACILLFIVAYFSKSYMHRESGFKRFYNHFLLFNSGLNLLLIAGNFETLFLGWEIIGICSFLLIAFYRERYLPVRNAMKVLSFYRISDVALVVAFCVSHHTFHTNVQFEQLQHAEFISHYLENNSYAFLFMSVLIVFAAAIKSAQMPFSSWLPRAMEGPTVSSAIFYGSMSVHMGVFLLIRTAPIWQNNISIKILIITIGLITAIISSFIASVQPTAKTQIAYSSITQIGIMFIEVGLGWHWLALVHFACNAFLRTYQLLISPGTMSYLTHEQFFNYDATKKPMFSFLPKKIANTIYMLSIKEWNVDFYWFQYSWTTFKKIGNLFNFIRNPFIIGALLILLIAIFIDYYIYPLNGLHNLLFVSRANAIIALILILVAWTERRYATRSWIFIAMSQLFFMLSIIQRHTFSHLEIAMYLSGLISSFVVGYWCLQKVKRFINNIDLNGFHGHIYDHPRHGLVFLLCALTMAGFPISPTFLGFDILFSEIELDSTLLFILSAFTFILLEISVLRIYARIFLGQHVKTYHEVAFRNS